MFVAEWGFQFPSAFKFLLPSEQRALHFDLSQLNLPFKQVALYQQLGNRLSRGVFVVVGMLVRRFTMASGTLVHSG